jgi:hypothetical protein
MSCHSSKGIVMSFDWKKTLSTVAPALATAFGTPLAGTAVKILADQLLGNPSASEQEVQNFISQGLRPEDIVALKKLELDFKQTLENNGIKLEELAIADKASAREREIKTGDSSTPRLLAMIVTVGFFSTLAYLIKYGKPEVGGDAVLLLLGSLGTSWTGVIAYYFGSSSGSKAKTDALERAANK